MVVKDPGRFRACRRLKIGRSTPACAGSTCTPGPNKVDLRWSGRHKTATWLWRDYLRANDQWVGWEAAEPGDLVFFKFCTGNPSDHVAMVSGQHSTNTYDLIEDNVPGDTDRVVKYTEYTRDSSLVAVYRPLWSEI